MLKGSGSPAEGISVPLREELLPLPGQPGWEPSPEAGRGLFGWTAFSLTYSQILGKEKGPQD